MVSLSNAVKPSLLSEHPEAGSATWQRPREGRTRSWPAPRQHQHGRVESITKPQSVSVGAGHPVSERSTQQHNPRLSRRSRSRWPRWRQQFSADHQSSPFCPLRSHRLADVGKHDAPLLARVRPALYGFATLLFVVLAVRAARRVRGSKSAAFLRPLF